jgi:hypothetical protein
MGHQRNWLARLLAYTTRLKALKKIDAILHMDHPCNATELHMFIGCVNYYRDMWPSHAHILKPLTDQSHFPGFGFCQNMTFLQLQKGFYTTPTSESVASNTNLTLRRQMDWLPPLFPAPLGCNQYPPLMSRIGSTIYI